jgi:hypothetical protein
MEKKIYLTENRRDKYFLSLTIIIFYMLLIFLISCSCDRKKSISDDSSSKLTSLENKHSDQTKVIMIIDSIYYDQSDLMFSIKIMNNTNIPYVLLKPDIEYSCSCIFEIIFYYDGDKEFRYTSSDYSLDLKMIQITKSNSSVLFPSKSIYFNYRIQLNNELKTILSKNNVFFKVCFDFRSGQFSYSDIDVFQGYICTQKKI